MQRTSGLGLVVVLAVGCVFCGRGLAAADTGGRVSQAVPAGTVLGGHTSQDWPIVLVLNKRGTQIVRITAGLRLACTSGGVARIPDSFFKLSIAGSGAFSESFGPMTTRNPDATTTDFESSVSGKLNRARTKGSGTWQFKATDHDAAGAVTDTCESGPVKWTVKN